MSDIRKEMIIKLITIRNQIQETQDSLKQLESERELIITMLGSIGVNGNLNDIESDSHS